MAGAPAEAGGAGATVPVVLLQGVQDALQHGALAVARSLGRLGVPVFTVSARPESASGRSRYLLGSAKLDLITARPAHLLEAIDALVGTSTRVLLLPLDDVAAMFVDEQPALRERGLLPTRPAGLLRALTDKRILPDLLAPFGIPTAATRPVSSEDELREAARAVGLPAVLKAGDPVAVRKSPGARSVTVAATLDALVGAYRCMGPDVAATALLQEHVGGSEGADWIFNGCFAADGDCYFHGTGIKLRQWPVGTGAATLAVSMPNAVVTDLSLRLARAVGYTGMIDLDFRFDARDGRHKLLDVNPRIGSSFRLFVAEDGTDLPRAYYMHSTGRPVPGRETRRGRKWMVEPRDLRSCLALMGSGQLKARDLMRSFAGVEETAWFDRRDVRPFAAMLSHYVSRLAGREG